MKLLLLSCLVVLASAAPKVADMEWESWKQTHGKQYKDDMEELRRFDTWKANRAMIEEHNSKGTEKYTLGLNEYSDLSPEEFVSIMNGYMMAPLTNSTGNTFKADKSYVPSENVDWREKGAVTNVKNQGQCGSCWSFSATGSLEGQHFLKAGNLVSLSEQNLMDCSTAEGDHACKGGLMDNAFRYIIKNHGIDTEESYPYRAHTEMFCRFKEADVGATMTSYKDIERGDVEALTQAIDRIGPISVAMDASRPAFHAYKRGVYSDRTCSSKKLDHGVLAVGYGTYEGTDYFLVKNSWGTTWGMEGYFMIERGYMNMCGLATQASYPIV